MKHLETLSPALAKRNHLERVKTHFPPQNCIFFHFIRKSGGHKGTNDKCFNKIKDLEVCSNPIQKQIVVSNEGLSHEFECDALEVIGS
jgi:hypothetical protein